MLSDEARQDMVNLIEAHKEMVRANSRYAETQRIAISHQLMGPTCGKIELEVL